MKKFTALVLFVFGLSFGFGQNPYSTYPGITITKLVDLPTSSFPVRIQRDPVSGDIFYSNFFGQVSRLIPNGTGYIDSTVYTTTDHGITHMQGFLFVDSNLFLVGNYKQFNQPGYGLVKRLKLDPSGARQVSTVMQTVPYPSSATLYDHAFSSIVKMPGKDSLLIASGARTDHGEVNDVNGLFPFTREVALTTSIFKIPYHGNNFTLPNDTAAIDALDAFYCKGVRNTFDMAYNQNGHLFGVENSDERDNPEEINWLRQGHHYGFPWMMGPNYNPQQYPGYNANTDNMLNHRTSAFQLGKFYNDSLYPRVPAGTVFDLPLRNLGPDADFYRDSASAITYDASITGAPMYGITPHRSPLGLVFDNDNKLAFPFTGDGFFLSYTATGDSAGNSPLYVQPVVALDTCEDLCWMSLNFDTINQSYTANIRRIVAGFKGPVDAFIEDNIIYVLENGNNEFPGKSIWMVHMPKRTPPVAYFNDSANVCTGFIAFKDSSLNNPSTWFWDFGDGSTSRLQNPTHNFSPGNFIVKLIVSNIDGADTISKSYQFNYPAAFAASNSPVCESGTISLSTTAVTAATYAWAGPGGFTSASRTPSLTNASVAMAGTYTVTVTANGCSTTDSVAVVVSTKPTANITLSPMPMALAPIVFLSNSTSDFHSWDFGDGTTSILNAPTHIYNTDGLFIVRYIGTNINNCFVTDTLHVNVLANGIEQLNSSAVKIYPNPANDFLVIDIAQNAGINQVNISIFNTLGQMLLQSKIQSQQQIDIRELPAGNYSVKIEANNMLFKYPLVIER